MLDHSRGCGLLAWLCVVRLRLGDSCRRQLLTALLTDSGHCKTRIALGLMTVPDVNSGVAKERPSGLATARFAIEVTSRAS